ncbi:MAG TPA: 4-hydroxythreonine-4-phosphate dehydrogenase PdxA [Candidatus Binatia bacterium]|nr:4-hydroxythreonine-4-phosphate dehydrogenase PdxA [Candidatus Binatia bacterium]
MARKPRIAIVIGDPSGIGPEVCVKALATGEPQDRSIPIFVGNIEALQFAAHVCNVDVRFRVVSNPAALDLPGRGSIAVIDPQDLRAADYLVGQPSGLAARAGVEWTRLAQEYATTGEIDGFVVGPMNHQSAMEVEPAGTFPLRISGPLRTVPLVQAALTKDALLGLIVTVDRHLRRWGIARPRVVVAGSDSHAAAAVAAAREQGIEASGPISPDLAFQQGLEKRSDAIVTTDRDQRSIAAETGAFTVFLGLPYVRIDVPHGTEYDIAGTGNAAHLTMLAAMNAAAALASGRGFEP